MTLKAIVETTDGIPEALREFYQPTEDGKGFKLSVEPVGGFALEDVSGLKSALGKERTEADKLRRVAEKFRDLDPDKARDALTRVAELEALDPTKEADKIAATKVEAATKQLLTKHQAEVASREERIGHLAKTVEQLLIDQAATAALAEARGSVDLLLPHVQKYTRVVERDGRFSVEIVDGEGNARINGKAEAFTIKDLVAEMRASDTFGRAFEASGQSGAGKALANGGAGGSGTRKPGDWAGGREGRLNAIANKFPDLPVR